MNVLAADINDAGITVLRDGAIAYREPGIALLRDDGLTIGNAAYCSARIHPRRIYTQYWSGLSTEALPVRHFEHLTAADLASEQLDAMWQSASKVGDSLVVAVPAYMSTEKLGLFLGICNELRVPVVAMVDAAVAATRRQYKNAITVHIDISLHSTLLTRLFATGQAQVESSMIVEDAGLFALYDVWIKAISETFVQQSRFDPLHTAETEQMVLDRLPGWLAKASAGENIVLELAYQGITHKAEMESIALIAAAAPVYQRIVSQLRTLCRADETPALQMTDRAAALPGLGEMLKARVGGEIFMLEAAATARGLIARCRNVDASGPVSLIRQLPWDQAAIEVEVEPLVSDGGRPTHVLFENTAFQVNAEPICFGTQATDGERFIELAQTMPGISRKHCTVQDEHGQCVVRDLSRYGTFLNGHRINDSALLQAGDTLRVGTPGFELKLIRVESSHGA